ncbi:MAG: transposase [Erysipelotrichaceae bacterium]|nr:transposase [Erysipelotrichaceae bacterium]
MNRSYRYLLKPDRKQKDIINGIIRDVNFLKKHYLEDEEKGRKFDRLLKDVLNGYIREYPELRNSDKSALLNVLFQISGKKRRESGKIPYTARYTTSNYHGKIKAGETVWLPLVGEVVMVYHRPVPKECEIKSATISRNNLGEYHISFLTEFDCGIRNLKLDVRNSVGLDYSSANLFVDDTGRRIDIPHFYREKEKRIIKLIDEMKRCEKGSANYFEKRNRLNRTYKNIASRRSDYLHKLSASIAEQYDIVCIEDLDVQSISKLKNLAKATYDNSYTLFTNMLKYKLEERGKKLIMIDRWYPSSKKCSCCGAVNTDLKMGERVWTCSRCGETHDRDINAAVNIRREGIRKYLNAVG